MKRKGKIMGTLSLSLLLASASTMLVNAAEESAMDYSNHSITVIASDFGDLEPELIHTGEEGEAEPRLFEKQYKVVSDKVTMRSGPGISYSAEGTLYKGDILYVADQSYYLKFYVFQVCVDK